MKGGRNARNSAAGSQLVYRNGVSEGTKAKAGSKPAFPLHLISIIIARVIESRTYGSALPHGVMHRELEMNRDERGSLTEIFRTEWDSGIEPVQWNAFDSRKQVLRGVHVHPRHIDYLVMLRGTAIIGLKDLRRGSPTEGLASAVSMSGAKMASLLIPPGVAHGFYFPEDSQIVYAVSSYWSLDDELGCRWDDPALQIPWMPGEVNLSPRDAAAPPLSDLLIQLEPWQPIGQLFR